jgi:membrane glycosyltransferase
MLQSIRETGAGNAFDFFILSDSMDSAVWIQEEMAWLNLCKRRDAFGHVFYRKRKQNQNGKSGNIADFCRRWGKRYRYMIVLDADSIMTGSLMLRLVKILEANPRVGIVQTAPVQAMGETPFRRLHQFALRVYAPIFFAGSNYWHLFGGGYWGHNAIVRLQPFIEHCDLPDLPGPKTASRHIMSHDTIEAALMRRAGYDVWFAYDEKGTYEEAPPNLAESLTRDRRWCQGNMQHAWFLLAPGIDFANRFHIWMGLMAYITSPLWLLFLIAGTADLALKHRVALLSSLPGDFASHSAEAIQILLIGTFALLLVPKLLGLLISLPSAKKFGGVFPLFLSMFMETLMSTLYAPVLMLYYSQFVLFNLLGIKVKWRPQNRAQGKGLSLIECCRLFWLPTALGVVAMLTVIRVLPYHWIWLSPILLGWLLAIPLAWITSSTVVGAFTRSCALFLTQEETLNLLPSELQNIQNPETQMYETSHDWSKPHAGIIHAVKDPLINAVHISLLRPRRTRSEMARNYMATLRNRLLREGPEALTPLEESRLLWDAESLGLLHRELWLSSWEQLHPVWKNA